MALAVEVFTMLRKGNYGNMVVLSVGGLMKVDRLGGSSTVDEGGG